MHVGIGVGLDIIQSFLSYHFKSSLKPGSVSSVTETQRHSLGDLTPVPAVITHVIGFQRQEDLESIERAKELSSLEAVGEEGQRLSGDGRVFPTYSRLSHGCNVFNLWPQLWQKQSLYFSVIKIILNFLVAEHINLVILFCQSSSSLNVVHSGFPFLPLPLEDGLKVSGTAWPQGFGDGEIFAPYFWHLFILPSAERKLIPLFLSCPPLALPVSTSI